MTTRQELQQRIGALELSRDLLDSEIAEARAALRKIEEGIEKKWRENPFAADRATKSLAAYFRELGYFLVGCENLNTETPFYQISKQIWKQQEVVRPFLRALFKHRAVPFVYPLTDVPADRKNSLINLCKVMQNNEWMTFSHDKSELRIQPSFPKSKLSFLNGGWAEDANRYFVYKVLGDYAKNHKLKYKVFWDVRLKQIDSDKNNSNDMQLDLVAQINDFYYVFETKSGTLGLQKWVERAAIFNLHRNRFLICSAAPVPLDPAFFKPYRLLTLDRLEEELPKLLDADLKEP